MASLARTLRPAATRVAQQPMRASKRYMGKHVDPATLPWPDNKIRAVLKEDWQVVVAIMSFYATLITVGKLSSGGKKAEAAPAAAVVAAGSAFAASGYKSGVEPGAGGVPSFTDDAFDAWSQLPGNMAKWEAEVAKM